MFDPNDILTWSDGFPVFNSADQMVPRMCFCGSRVHLEFHGEPVLVCVDHAHYWGALKCRDNPTVEVK